MVQHRLDHPSRPPALGGRKRGASLHAIGRSRGGPSTKVHLVIDALGLPVEIDITVGQRYDCVPAAELLERCNPKCVLADKAYDSNALREHLSELGAEACIPSHPRRIVAHDYDRDLYRAAPRSSARRHCATTPRWFS